MFDGQCKGKRRTRRREGANCREEKQSKNKVMKGGWGLEVEVGAGVGGEAVDFADFVEEFLEVDVEVLE